MIGLEGAVRARIEQALAEVRAMLDLEPSS
jgi:hypothetical protein